MIKLSVNETKWSSLLTGTRALTLYIAIWIFYFAPEKLLGLSTNGPQVLHKFHFRWYFQQSKTVFSVVVFFQDNIGVDEKLRHLRSFSGTNFSFHKVFDWQLFNFYDSFFNWPLSDSTSHHTVKLTYTVCPARADVNQMPMQTRFSLVIDILRIMQKVYNLKIINEWGWASYFTIKEWS